MNQIRSILLYHSGPLHFRKIERQRDLIVEWKGKTLRVLNLEIEDFGRKVDWLRLTVNSQDINFVACLAEEFEHFLESVGVARHMRERSWLDH